MTTTRGRKTKLTAETKDKFLHAIRLGASYEIACGFAGITYQTYLNWKEKAAQPENAAFFDFFEDITRAESEAAVHWLTLVEKHATDDPKWAIWKLERRYPKDYGQRTRTELTGADGGAIRVQAVDYRAGLKAVAPDDDA